MSQLNALHRHCSANCETANCIEYFSSLVCGLSTRSFAFAVTVELSKSERIKLHDVYIMLSWF